ncbi:MAG: ATP-binding protein, partial [Chloroflexi bacterium]|nr:ATP-binding protein [Chloroflexota bacterium]
DQGRGLTPENIAQIDAYIQFERQTYEQQGAGLGLTLARRLAEFYGGSLQIVSTPGVGTVIRVALPGV